MLHLGLSNVNISKKKSDTKILNRTCKPSYIK